jgi:hypothetical protein
MRVGGSCTGFNEVWPRDSHLVDHVLQKLVVAPDFSDEVIDVLAVAILGLLVATLAISLSVMSITSISISFTQHVLCVLEACLVVQGHARTSTVRAACTA